MSESNSGAPAAPSSAPAAESSQADSSTNSQASQSDNGSAEVESIQEALENGEISDAQASKMLKKFQLKVRGKVIDREIDMNDHDYIRDQLQLAEVSRQEMQQGAELRKAYQREMERLRSDPMSVLAELGLDPEEVSASFINKKIEEMKKSPEQLASERMAKELAEAREEARKLKEEREQEQMTKLQAEAAKSLNDEIDKAISGHKKLSNTQAVRKRIADAMLWAMNNGHGDVTAEDVVPMVEKEMREEHRALFEGFEDDALEDWVGRDRLAKLKKKKVPAKVPGLNDVKPTTGGIRPQEESKPSQKVRAKDLFRNMGK